MGSENGGAVGGLSVQAGEFGLGPSDYRGYGTILGNGEAGSHSYLRKIPLA